MAKRVTLADVARVAGVSIAAASMVLRDRPGIPLATRQRVTSAARSLGYVPRASPPHLETVPGSIDTLGVVVKFDYATPPRANPFYAHVIAGIEETCRQRNINLLYAMMPVDRNNVPVQVPRMLTDSAIRGILLVGALVDETLSRTLSTCAVPVVLVDAYTSSGEYDAVVSDNMHGAYQAVEYLICRGHCHIGLVGSMPDAYPSIHERRRGYIKALRDHGITQTYFADSSLDDDEATEAARVLLAPNPQITAIFGCNDNMAIAAMRAAQSLGRRVPEELSCISFDDTDLASYAIPALTSMHVDKVGMGRMGVQRLLNRLEVPDAVPVTVVMHPRLIERSSVITIAGGDGRDTHASMSERNGVDPV